MFNVRKIRWKKNSFLSSENFVQILPKSGSVLDPHINNADPKHWRRRRFTINQSINDSEIISRPSFLLKAFHGSGCRSRARFIISPAAGDPMLSRVQPARAL
jgi:hypothetical protein